MAQGGARTLHCSHNQLRKNRAGGQAAVLQHKRVACCCCRPCQALSEPRRAPATCTGGHRRGGRGGRAAAAAAPAAPAVRWAVRPWDRRAGRRAGSRTLRPGARSSASARVLASGALIGWLHMRSAGTGRSALRRHGVRVMCGSRLRPAPRAGALEPGAAAAGRGLPAAAAATAAAAAGVPTTAAGVRAAAARARLRAAAAAARFRPGAAAAGAPGLPAVRRAALPRRPAAGPSAPAGARLWAASRPHAAAAAAAAARPAATLDRRAASGLRAGLSRRHGRTPAAALRTEPGAHFEPPCRVAQPR
jgi:hypothetical protein